MFNLIYKLYFRLFKGVKFGKNVKICFPCNLYRCYLADNVFIGPYTEVQNDVYIGQNSRISSHSFIAAGSYIGKDVFVAHNVITTNDKTPKVDNKNWKCQPIMIKDGCCIGSGTVLCPGIKMNEGGLLGAGAVLTRDIPKGEVWVGNPAKKKK